MRCSPAARHPPPRRLSSWTKYGGSQFVDSPGTSRYHSCLCDEVVPWVDAHCRTLAAGPHRAISGKSSGGFGTMFTPMSLAWLCHRTAE
jgi:enterochelin esterase-like enzyme